MHPFRKGMLMRLNSLHLVNSQFLGSARFFLSAINSNNFKANIQSTTYTHSLYGYVFNFNDKATEKHELTHTRSFRASKNCRYILRHLRSKAPALKCFLVAGTGSWGFYRDTLSRSWGHSRTGISRETKIFT